MRPSPGRRARPHGIAAPLAGGALAPTLAAGIFTGGALAPGLYFARLRTRRGDAAAKIVRIR